MRLLILYRNLFDTENCLYKDKIEVKHMYLNTELLAGRQVCKLWGVVIDVGNQDVNRSSCVETRMALVSHHHPQTVLALVLSVQRHPVDNFPWRGSEDRHDGEDTQMHREASYD